MLSAWGLKVSNRLRDTDPWTNVYGWGRTLLAAATALTLLVNPVSVLFVPSTMTTQAPICWTLHQQGTLFCLLRDHAGMARWLGFALLLLVASGYRPRFTAPIHAFLAHSVAISVTPVDGGDQAASILAILILPIALLDDRRWHWQRRTPSISRRELWKRSVADVAHSLIRVQVAAIYFDAAFGKMKVDEWVDGTALYYHLNNPIFGMVRPVSYVMTSVLSNAISLALLTWSVIALELALAAAIIATHRARALLFFLGIVFHIGIFVIQGISSFSLIMCGALVLYLRDWNEPFARFNSFSFPRFQASWARVRRVVVATGGG